MKVGDLVRRARYKSPDGRITGRSGKEAGGGLIICEASFGYKIKWHDEETEIMWISGDSLEMVSEA